MDGMHLRYAFIGNPKVHCEFRLVWPIRALLIIYLDHRCGQFRKTVSLRNAAESHVRIKRELFLL